MTETDVGRKEYDWAGLWLLNRRDMTWWRKYHHRHFETGKKTGDILDHRGPMVRPGVLRNVVHLDVPLAVLRSHPDSPDTLPEDAEGIWTDTNPAWPEQSVKSVLGKYRAKAVWEETAPDMTETYELTPSFVGDVTVENSEPFDEEPLVLSAVLIYARPSELATTATRQA